MRHQFALGSSNDGGVVGTGHTPIGRDDDERHLLHVGGLIEQRMIDGSAAGREVLDDLGDLAAVGPGCRGALLRLDDAGRGDEFHRARDLLGRLHALDASPKDAFLAAGHSAISPRARFLPRAA